MPSFSNEYRKAMKAIEQTISNPTERATVLRQVQGLSLMYMDLIDRISKLDDDRIELLEDTVERLGDTVNLIKNDIYEEDSYDFEIVCPYCNHEFVADVESELKEEIECPECHNKIEIDWEDDDEDGCGGCSSNHCSHCVVDFPNMNNNEDFEKLDEEEDNEDDSDDDM